MELMDTILNRRSVRKYNGTKISEGVLHDILEAGLLAPSSRNLHPTELIVIKDKATLKKLSRVKTAGSAMLADASCAVAVIGNSEISDAWIEDCSLAMIYMQLRATDLDVASCWVQCRGRRSSQNKDEPISDAPALNKPTGEIEVAARIRATENSDELMTSEEYARELLKIPDKYSLEAILALGMSDETKEPYTKSEADFSKVHEELYK